MNSEKYIGLDVHQATISVAVMDSQGKIVMESILDTKASTLLEFLAGIGGAGKKTIVWMRRPWPGWPGSIPGCCVSGEASQPAGTSGSGGDPGACRTGPGAHGAGEHGSRTGQKLR